MVRYDFETEGGLTETDGVIEVGAAEEQLHPSTRWRAQRIELWTPPTTVAQPYRASWVEGRVSSC